MGPCRRRAQLASHVDVNATGRLRDWFLHWRPLLFEITCAEVMEQTRKVFQDMASVAAALHQRGAQAGFGEGNLGIFRVWRLAQMFLNMREKQRGPLLNSL
jgi:hypothetical protein